MFASVQKANETTAQVMYLVEVAETLREDALERAMKKFTSYARDLPLAELLKRADFCDSFKYELALGVAAVLAANDQRVQTAYIYDPSGNPDGVEGIEVSPDATLYLLVKVSTPSAALDAFVSSVDRALTANLKELPSPLFAQRESILVVSLISEEDMVLRRGCAALLASIFAPPLKIWERGA